MLPMARHQLQRHDFEAGQKGVRRPTRTRECRIIPQIGTDVGYAAAGGKVRKLTVVGRGGVHSFQ